MLLMMSENIALNMYSSQGTIYYPTQLHLVGHFRKYLQVFVTANYLVIPKNYVFRHRQSTNAV